MQLLLLLLQSNARIRIHNIIHELNRKIFYIDTDSLFTNVKIPDYYINNELGDLKDKLNGQFIESAYFIAPKIYGLKLQNNPEPIIKTKSVPKDKISFNDLKKLYKGETFTINVSRIF